MLFKLLLRLYPPNHRGVFAQEMLTVLAQEAEASRARGRAAYARFLIGESAGLLGGGCREWLRLTGPASANAAPVIGGLAVAGGFQVLLYHAAGQASERAVTAINRAHIPPDQNVAGLMVAIYAVTWLVCLAPVFFMLSIHLRRGRR